MYYDVIGSISEMLGAPQEIDLREMDKLAKGLEERGIPYIKKPCFDGQQIICDSWDAICHRGSYGHERGLLEIMGSIVQNDKDTVEGFLSAEDILSRL